MYDRFIRKSIESWLFKGKIVIIYGARQVGKTTLSKQILDKFGKDSLYLNCEIESVKDELSKAEPARIRSFFGNKKIVVLDEAQSIENIGRILKTFVDEYKDIQIIATGSSSFDLANKINEPLTGRSIDFMLFPLSIGEIIKKDGLSEFKANEEIFFRFGSYPGIYSKRHSQEEMVAEIENIQSHYLYKDILSLENIRKPKILQDLLKLLAFKIGSEASLNELANNLHTSIATIDRYIDLLEKAFIIKKVSAFSRNLRNEINKNFKVYFWDIGLRNMIVRNMNPIDTRDDIGKLFENIFITERIKMSTNMQEFKNYYFWRTYEQKEIDLIEEYAGGLHAFECKYSNHRLSETTKKTFMDTYPGSSLELVTKDNYLDFLI